ncbi:MAG: heme o synthase [Planctomycetaceae bacterium]
MSTVETARPCATSSTTPHVSHNFRELVATRISDYIDLTRPKIALLSLLTVTVGYVLAATEGVQVFRLLHALFGITLVAAGSSALNQFVERLTDGRMTRTASRPLPSGRLSPLEVFLMGSICGTLGCLYLWMYSTATTALLALTTLLLYVLVYTPLKRRTSFCTVIGAIPGALPPVLGWTAAGGTLNSGAFALFVILFLWQFPHFLAIAWLYRHQYSGAGLKMLPAYGKPRGLTGFLAVCYALALIPASLLPSQFAFAESLAGDRYTWTALILGMGYLFCSIRFFIRESENSARGLLWSSLIYLPVLLVALTWDHFQLLS